MNYDERWIDNFYEQAKAVQIEFDAFLKNRKLSDYYHFHRGENGQLISLHFPQAHGLPKEIENALPEAFIKSKPDR
ncbi:hypothetical protein [Flavisolibacter ginsenosidimutans]|uniref:Uncharacterized protein n=1 Tax=Flavisolibacter ginsenosidimutans TaxID=661481 RepID=A0A5B8UIU1_9BACT|nr:hypothetical protein [Flavisolibacter ginsenosidimutans]QEC56601.1 hypothetical protein FSB75_12085 [Flavisolibacter ginsenosidimutans]